MPNATGTQNAPADRVVETRSEALLDQLARRPDDLETRRRLAALYRAAGWRLDEAREWAAVLEADPADETARSRLKRLGPIVEIVGDAAASNPPSVRLTVHRRTVVISLDGVASPCTEEGPSEHFGQQHVYVKRLLECGFTGFVVDLSGVTFLGSHFLGALVTWARSVARRGGRLVLCGLRPELRGVLRITQLIRVVRCCETLDEAVAFLDTPGTPA